MKYYIVLLNGEDVEHLSGSMTDSEIEAYLVAYYSDVLDQVEIEMSYY